MLPSLPLGLAFGVSSNRKKTPRSNAAWQQCDPPFWLLEENNSPAGRSGHNLPQSCGFCILEHTCSGSRTLKQQQPNRPLAKQSRIFFFFFQPMSFLRASWLQLCHRVKERVQLKTEHFNPCSTLLRLNVFQQHYVPFLHLQIWSYSKIITASHDWAAHDSNQTTRVLLWRTSVWPLEVNYYLLHRDAFHFIRIQSRSWEENAAA